MVSITLVKSYFVQYLVCSVKLGYFVQYLVCSVKLHFFVEFRSVPFRASELALPRNSECLGMSTFFRGITEIVRVYSTEFFRNEIPFPTLLRSQKNQHKVTFTSQSDFRIYWAASQGFLLILWWRPFKMRKKICRASSLLLRIEWAYSHLSVQIVGQYL